MSRVQDKSRLKTVEVLAIIAGALWLGVLLMALFGPHRGGESPRTGQPVLENFSTIRDDVGEIRLTMADDTYSLKLGEDGWGLSEAGGYPVRADRLSQLAEGLETLTWGARRTSNPDKLSQIGLGDPREGGNGVLVEVFARNGALSASMITGRRGPYIYARKPDDNLAFRAEGDLPPLYSRQSWLDLDIVDIDASAISAVRLTDSRARSVYLERPAGGGSRDFVLAPPYQNDVLVSSLAASTTALAISRLAPVDVKAETALSTSPVSRHITSTYDGLEIDLRTWREPDGFWVTLRAIEAGEGARRARTINDRADGWAFRLSEYDWADFAPSIASIVRAPETVEPASPIPSEFQP